MASFELIGTPDGPPPASVPRTLARWSVIPLAVGGAVAAAVAAAPVAVGLGALSVLCAWAGARDVRARITLRVDDDALVVDDPDAPDRIVLPLAALRAVRLQRLTARDVAQDADASQSVALNSPSGDVADRAEVLLVLADRQGTALTLRLHHEPDVIAALPEVEQAALAELVGVPAPTVAPHRLLRQVIDDPTGQLAHHLALRTTPRVSTRLALRTWSEPPHPGLPPVGTLEIDGDAWRLIDTRSDPLDGVLLLPRVLRSGPPDTVRVELGPTHGTEALLSVSFVAPALAAGLRTPTDALAPTHWLDPHEGALLLAHVLTRGPESTWPAALRQRLGVVRGAARVRSSVRPPGKPAAGGTGARG